MPTILILEDDLTFLAMLSKWLQRKGFNVREATSIREARRLIESVTPDLMVSDMRLPDGDSLELLALLQESGCRVPVIIMTGYADVQNAVVAMKRGARDYISKPFAPDVLMEKITDVLGSAVPCIVEGRKEPGVPSGYVEGHSAAATTLYRYVSLVAPTNMSVLITGPNGTGKEYVAQRIHKLSKRASKPFVAIDCGALLKEISASELFGHVKGAFTGTVGDKKGAFEEANGGTLFLDEVGNLGYEVQVQLLRAIQERKIRPVGSSREISVDVRLVCATNSDLLAAIAEGSFREDLYHRLNEFGVSVPPLKDRGDDIFEFAEEFLKNANAELSRDVSGFSPEALSLIKQYGWPGNLRQLRNVIKKAVLLCQGSEIGVDDMPDIAFCGSSAVRPLRDSDEERRRIVSALKANGGNKAKTAIMLGVDRKTLYNKLKLYGI